MNKVKVEATVPPWDFGIWSFIKSKHKNKKESSFYTVPIVLVQGITGCQMHDFVRH